MTFSRRPGARFNRGRIQQQGGSAAAPTTPLTILGSLAWWVRADQVALNGGNVATATDLSGNGIHFTQGTAANQPLWVASAINGKPAIRGDGVDDILSATWARVAPGTQPFYIWAIINQITWTSGDIPFGDFNSVGPVGFAVQQAIAASPNLTQYNGVSTNNNNAGTLGSYFRLEAFFNNTAASYQKIGATSITGGNPANNAGSGTMQLFAAGSINPAKIELAEIFAFLGAPSAPQRAALDAYATSTYGAGLV